MLFQRFCSLIVFNWPKWPCADSFIPSMFFFFWIWYTINTVETGHKSQSSGVNLALFHCTVFDLEIKLFSHTNHLDLSYCKHGIYYLILFRRCSCRLFFSLSVLVSAVGKDLIISMKRRFVLHKRIFCWSSVFWCTMAAVQVEHWWRPNMD